MTVVSHIKEGKGMLRVFNFLILIYSLFLTEKLKKIFFDSFIYIENVS